MLRLLVSPRDVCLLVLGLILVPAQSGPTSSAVGPSAAAAAVAVPELKLYDCQAEADIWEVAWTPDWKVWCCQHESKGCPPTTTLTATVTSTSTGTDTSTRSVTQTATSTRTWTVTRTPTTTHTDTLTATATQTVTMTETQSETTEPDAGCQSDCVILGEHGSCQSRITLEEQQRNQESAPCPAAHVVVMSQCDSCGKCLFKDVTCASQLGVSKNLGRHTFMYKKYTEEPTVQARLQPQRLPAIMLAGISLVPFAIAFGAVRRHRHRRGRAADASDMDRDLDAFMVAE